MVWISPLIEISHPTICNKETALFLAEIAAAVDETGDGLLILPQGNLLTVDLGVDPVVSDTCHCSPSLSRPIVMRLIVLREWVENWAALQDTYGPP
jgi:hypothetical protein